jgi:hypothetical protein
MIENHARAVQKLEVEKAQLQFAMGQVDSGELVDKMRRASTKGENLRQSATSQLPFVGSEPEMKAEIARLAVQNDELKA